MKSYVYYAPVTDTLWLVRTYVYENKEDYASYWVSNAVDTYVFNVDDFLKLEMIKIGNF